MLTKNDEKSIINIITKVLKDVVMPSFEMLYEKMSGVEESLGAGIEKVEKRLDGVENRLEQIDRKLDHFSDKVQIHDVKISDHDKRIKILEDSAHL